MTPSTIAFCEKCMRILSRKALARAAAAAVPSSEVSIAFAMATAELGANNASMCVSNISGMPPTFAAIIGIPAAAASITT